MTIHRIPFTYTSPQGVEAKRIAIVDTDKLRGMAYACLNNKTKRSVEAGGALVVTFDDGRRTAEPGLTAGIRPAVTPDPIRAQLVDMLAQALPFVEDAEADPVYKPGAVAAMVRKIREALAQAEG